MQSVPPKREGGMMGSIFAVLVLIVTNTVSLLATLILAWRLWRKSMALFWPLVGVWAISTLSLITAVFFFSSAYPGWDGPFLWDEAFWLDVRGISAAHTQVMLFILVVVPLMVRAESK